MKNLWKKFYTQEFMYKVLVFLLVGTVVLGILFDTDFS